MSTSLSNDVFRGASLGHGKLCRGLCDRRNSPLKPQIRGPKLRTVVNKVLVLHSLGVQVLFEPAKRVATQSAKAVQSARCLCRCRSLPGSRHVLPASLRSSLGEHIDCAW